MTRMENVFFAALGGALVCWGIVLRGKAKAEYEALFKEARPEYRAAVNARLSSQIFNANAAILAGVVCLFIAAS